MRIIRRVKTVFEIDDCLSINVHSCHVKESHQDVPLGCMNSKCFEWRVRLFIWIAWIFGSQVVYRQGDAYEGYHAIVD